MTAGKKRKPIPPRAQLAIAIVVPLLAIAAGWMLVVSPQRSKAAETADLIVAKENEIQLARTAAAHVAKPEPIRVADIFRLAKALPDDEDMAGIILQLNDIAAEAGVEFRSIIPGDVVPGQGYYKRQIELIFAGDYYGLSDFLYRMRGLVGVRGGELDASGRLFAVDQIQFTEGVPAFPQIDATIVVDAFVFGSEPGAVPAPPPASAEGEAGSTEETTTTTESSEAPSASGATGEAG